MPIRFSIVDDDERVLDCLKHGLELAGGYVCAGCHRNTLEALDLIPTSRTDIVLMDIKMPGISGIECTRRLKVLLPALPVIILTGVRDEQLLTQSLIAGASGCLVKPITALEARDAIAEVTNGGAPLSKEVRRALLHVFNQSTRAKQPHVGLTGREREIMACLHRDLSDKEIAALLGIGTATVHSHMHRMFEKLGASSRSEAVHRYLYVHDDIKL
jgi:DNA-binding NarL/FixJ family response regulator